VLYEVKSEWQRRLGPGEFEQFRNLLMQLYTITAHADPNA